MSNTVEVARQEIPIENRLEYGSGFHDQILRRIVARLDLSEKAISQRYDDWDRVDENTRLYIDLSRKAKRADGTQKNKQREYGDRHERAIVIPYTYAALEVFLTQIMSLFLARDPMLGVIGRGPEDIKRAKIMEVVLAYNLMEMVAPMVLRSNFQDALKYGMGPMYDTWDTRMGLVEKKYDPQKDGLLALIDAATNNGKPVKELGVVSQFNRWESIDPFSFRPDPRVPVAKHQDGEFIGHRFYKPYLYIYERRQKGQDGIYFNVQALKELNKDKRSNESDRSRSRFMSNDFSMAKSSDENDKGYYALDHIQIRLIPSEWELSDNEEPEIWWFTIAEKACIIRAHPSDYEHGQFTYSVTESNPDPHCIFNPGKLEDADGIQRFVNWIIGSNMDAARKDLNDAGIINQELLELSDITNPNAGRWVRLTQPGMDAARGGTPLAAMMQRFPAMDRSTVNLSLVSVLYDQFQRMFGLSDGLMGMPSPDKRTLGEMQQVQAAASQRIGMLARIFDTQAVAPLARRAIANIQQFTDSAQYYRIAGDLESQLGIDGMSVNPADLAGDFDYIPVSAMQNSDPAKNAGVWMQLLQALAKFPQLAAPTPDGKKLDVNAVFNEAMRTMGIRNMNSFYINAAVPMPNQQVQQAVQQGNMVPMQGATNG